MTKVKINALGAWYDSADSNFYAWGEAFHPSIRRLKDISDLLYDKRALGKMDGDLPIYFMYRDVKRSEDEQVFRSNSVRYDVTVVPPRMIGEEFVKTVGHYHPLIEEGLTFPEIYQVMQGKAHYLLQKGNDGYISDVILIKAKRGDIVFIPPNYGHITINPSDANLVMANLVSSRFDSLYEQFKEKHGGAYYELAGSRFLKNDNYISVPQLRIVQDQTSKLPQGKRDIYSTFIEMPSYFSFLNDPKSFNI